MYRISNSEGKTWTLPEKNLRLAMCIYQPSGRNGILLKKFFPLLHSCELVRKLIHAEKIHYALDEQLATLIKKLFNTDDFEYSIFHGTPSVHQKQTIQISKGNRILGYCKTSSNPEVYKLFAHEQKILSKLEEKGIGNVPRCLYMGEIGGEYAFIQTTTKTLQSKENHEWGKIQEDFSREIFSTTKNVCKFEETTYFSELLSLQQHLEWLPEDQQVIVEENLSNTLNHYKGKEICCGMVHGDFTPWNSFVEKDSLFVFDWEYAQADGIQPTDHYHFTLQNAIFEQHLNEDEALAEMQEITPKGDFWQLNLYLLSIIARYTLREGRKKNNNFCTFHTKLLNLLNKQATNEGPSK